MTGALLLADGRFVENYTMGGVPFKMSLVYGSPTEFTTATSLKELIEKFTDHREVMIVPVGTPKDKRVKRQLTTRRRYMDNLEREMRQPVLNTEKIELFRKEIEAIERNIK